MLLVTSSMQSYADQLVQALNSNDIIRAITLLDRVSPLRSARILADAPLPTTLELLTTIGWQRSGRIAAHFPPTFAVTLLRELPPASAEALLGAMPVDAAVDVLQQLPDDEARGHWERLDVELREQIEQLAAHPEGTAGAVMSPYYLAVTPEALVEDVVEAVRSAPPEVERTAYVFVVHPASRRLLGVVSLRELMLSDPNANVADLMTRDVFAARAHEPAVDAARRIRSRRLKMLPVVDESDRLLGVIGAGQAMDLLAQELADDFVALHAASPDESFQTPPRDAVRKRLPWMAGNVFLNLGAVAVIASFESTIVQVAILAAFLPMITDMGGNVGIQALSVSIRSLALGEARIRDVGRAVRKELAIGIVNGLLLGALLCVVAWTMEANVVLGIVAGIALAVNVLVAGIVGGTMPFLIKRIGKDPAMMTGPVLTTITDITGVSIYLGLATLFLSSLLAGGAM
jgi:magnesium transporter